MAENTLDNYKRMMCVPGTRSMRLRVVIPGFQGSYGDADFDDSGVCENLRSVTFRNLLRERPGLRIAEYMAHQPKNGGQHQ